METKMTKTQEWFVTNVVDNIDENVKIGEISNAVLHNKLSIGLNNPYSTMAIYAKVFEAIRDVLKDKQDRHDEYAINIADRLVVGYTNTNSDDDEKSGNYMITIMHMDNKKSDDTIDDDESDTLTLCTQWNATHVTTQTEIVKEIARRAKKEISNLIDIKFSSDEFIIPMFCIIHNQIIDFIKLKRVETKQVDYEITVAGLYKVGVQMTEDGDEDIYFIPGVPLRLDLKNDASATGSSEED